MLMKHGREMTRIPIARGGRRPYIHRAGEINGGCILHSVSVSLPTFVVYVRSESRPRLGNFASSQKKGKLHVARNTVNCSPPQSG